MNQPVGIGLACRLCGTPLPAPFLDLGAQPLPDRLVEPGSADAAAADPRYVTALAACTVCGLIQLSATPPPEVDLGHGHGVAASSSLAAADRAWAAGLLEHAPAGAVWRVEVLGDAWAIDPVLTAAGHEVAAASAATGGSGFDLVIVNHALAHADALGDALSAIADSVRPGGLVAIETHHALGLAEGQSDVVSPVHRTYLTLACLAPALAARGLTVVAAALIDRYGGALRVLARRGAADGELAGAVLVGGDTEPVPDDVASILAAERAAGLADPAVLAAIGERARTSWSDLRDFLRETREAGRTVIGYGAASRGIALLNAADVTAQDLPLIVDRSPAKQGRLTPGGRIPIADPARLAERRPDLLLVLAWPLIAEVAKEQAGIAAWGGRFAVALPTLRILEPAAVGGAAAGETAR